MENGINKVTLSGFAGADVEVKQLSENQKLARVNLAVHEYYRNGSGEDVSKTNWITLTFWNVKADEAEAQIKKGSFLTVEGRIQTGSYEAKDGTRRFTTEIIVNELSVRAAELSK
ncbi:single-stranded DNA-binding protein [Pedobacter frigidisoli]|uniref:single-stranded DNA-binding protein n=1 Tax=Pedobacter frigidisoli TaxID=2530455 RepID=UPI0029313BA9|nr:single-stranded DNA-binding protein [Pedobacter frigidisoli]